VSGGPCQARHHDRPAGPHALQPTRESKNLFVPGLMAFVLTIISSLMTAISLTREKETGTMEALLVSPLRPWEIIVGKVTPYFAIGFISVIAVLVEALLLFRVPLRGSVLLLLFEGALYILVSLSLGILISARTSSQRVAMMFALLGTMLPNILLSGFIFPLESMPAALQAISYVVPGRWFVTIARGIMLKGIGLTYVWRETLVSARWQPCCWWRVCARSTSGWSNHASHPVSGAGRSPPHPPRSHPAGTGAGRARRAAPDSLERGDL
jgi:ABC-type transport system involved in multi-copper enzyme maturation permease subunit